MIVENGRVSSPRSHPRWLPFLATRELRHRHHSIRRRLFRSPLGVLALTAIAALLCGIFLQPQGYILFGSVLASIILGLLWPWISLWGLRGSIAFSKDRAVEGETIEACVTVRNRLPWGAYGLSLLAGLGKRGTDDEQACSIKWAPGRDVVEARWNFAPPRRGQYPLAPPRLITGFPFGLSENVRELTVTAPVLVWPRTYPVGPVPVATGESQVEGAVSRHRVGNGGDVLGVRPYRRGDSPRLIHWGQTARHDQLIVCELQANARPVIQLVLDSDIGVHTGDGSDSSREWAIRIVASLAKGWIAAGVEVGAAWNGEAIAPASGQKQVHTLLDALARLPDDTDMPLGRALDCPACRCFTSGLQLVVTTDRGAARFRPARGANQRHWVVLRTQGFASGSDQPPTPNALPIRPSLEIHRPEEIPVVLRSGWRDTVLDD